MYDYEARYRRQMVQMNVKLAKATDRSRGASRRWSRTTRTHDQTQRACNSLTIRLEQFEVDVNLKKEALAAAAVQTAYRSRPSLSWCFRTGETTRLVAKYHPSARSVAVDSHRPRRYRAVEGRG